MEFAAVDIETRITWSKIEYTWLLPSITAITCFILEYTWPGRWLTRRNLALLSIAPLLSTLFSFTNDFHHLSFIGFRSYEPMTPQYGPIGWAFVIYAYMLTILNIVVLIWLFRHSPQHRWSVVIIVIGQIAVRVLFLLDSARGNSWFSTIPELIFAYLAYAIALFGFHIFDPVPLAHKTVIAQMREGMLVSDTRGRVVSINPAAKTMLGLPAKNALGQPIVN